MLGLVFDLVEGVDCAARFCLGVVCSVVCGVCLASEGGLVWMLVGEPL